MYLRVFLTFARNSLIRDLSFRSNFALQCLSSIAWVLMNFGLFKIIFRWTESIGAQTGWREHEFFVFLGTIWIVNAIVQALFMPNAEEFSELIRTGNLDFALLKPIDTQFLVSLPKIAWSQVPNLGLGIALVGHSVWQLAHDSAQPLVVYPWTLAAYALYVLCGAVILYSVMFTLAATSVWMGRNQNLHTFWFYITNFYRYPMEIYQRGGLGWALWGTFTFLVPILVVAYVPARILAQPLRPGGVEGQWLWAAFTLFASAAALAASRWVFQRALVGYRSASS